jgi:gamma-glutamylcyclotransferase (GGCT)/AIG2-like uncharacterized protein YtfP
MENTITTLFVYGSLRRAFRTDAYEYVSDHFTLVGEAKVKGKLYHTGEYPAAIPTVEESFVTGELYELKKECGFAEAIGPLDDYEEADSAAPEVQLYRREITEVLFNGKAIPAWIYWYNRDVNGKISIISGDILDYICAQSK